MKWTAKRLAILTTMWANDETSGQIARRLGVTRCAVAGKIHRLGLTKRMTDKQRARQMSKGQAAMPLATRQRKSAAQSASKRAYWARIRAAKHV